MTTTTRTTIIDAADHRGVPIRAHCSACGWMWCRRVDDPDAARMSPDAREHPCEPPLPFGDAS